MPLALETLQDLFPETDPRELERAPEASGGTLEQAVDFVVGFVDNSPAAYGVPQVPAGPTARAKTPRAGCCRSSSPPIDLTSTTPPPIATDAIPAHSLAETPLEMLSTMFPEADPGELNTLLRNAETAERAPGVTAAELVTQQVLEAGKDFPKRSAKRKRDGEDGEDASNGKRRRTFEVEPHRGISHAYLMLCKEQAQRDFPDIPLPFVWKICAEKRHQYPAVFEAFRQAKQKVSEGVLVYKTLIRPRNYSRRPFPAVNDEEFVADLQWVKEQRELIQQESDRSLAEKLNEEEYEATGNSLECGCCYTNYSFEKMVQCDDGHLFCSECARRAAELNIGLRRTDFPCISSDGCKYSFPRDQVLKFLSKKAFKGWENIKAEEEIRMAALDGLVKCPYCDFAAVVQDDGDKEFRCQGPDCLTVSCRNCRQKSHLPQTCEEYAKENALDARHSIEEAMTEALCRQCPKCCKKFFKEEGCNKMTCSCGTRMCYVCRAVIKDYEHFNSGCPLWDDTITRNASEVNAAAEDALKQSKDQRPDLGVHMDLAAIKVAIPVPKPSNAIAVDGVQVIGGAVHINEMRQPRPIPAAGHVAVEQAYPAMANGAQQAIQPVVARVANALAHVGPAFRDQPQNNRAHYRYRQQHPPEARPVAGPVAGQIQANAVREQHRPQRPKRNQARPPAAPLGR